MFVIGIILILAGAGSMFYGNLQNTDLISQLNARFSDLFSESGLLSSISTNPGDIYVYAGTAAIVIGLILVVAGRKK